jgi:hypothetical protein
MIGTDEVPADMALLFRSILLSRSPQTHLVTNARSSLKDASVLVWLMGDTRTIREDAKLYFRKTVMPATEGDHWKSDELETEPAEVDLEELHYAQVLQYIDHFLPVKELAGRPMGRDVLRQFGLVDNEKVDHFLASAFAKSAVNSESDRAGPHSEHPKSKAEVPSPGDPSRQE